MKKKRFIFDENYIKRYAKKDTFRWLVIAASLLVLILIIIIVIMANRTSKKPVIKNYSFELKDELVVEAGSELPDVADYFNKLESVDTKSIEIIYPEDFEISYDTTSCSEEEIEEINKQEEYNPEEHSCIRKTLKTLDTYGITLKILDKEYTVNLTIQDTLSPIISLKAFEMYVGDTYTIEDFISFCKDASGECSVNYYEGDLDENGNLIDYGNYTNPGEYNIRIYASDDLGNISDVYETKLTITGSETPLYTVTFNSNGGSSIKSVIVPEGEKVDAPTNPTKDGYNFIGWYFGNAKYDFNSTITRNITLSAKWEKIQSGGNQTGDTPNVINVNMVSLDFKKINLYIGESKTVTAYVLPNNATNKTITWSSSNNSIATVSGGKITGIGVGTTTIIASADGKSSSVEVVVREKSSGTSCVYGDTNYNTQYILSVNLANGNCAVDPNNSYNEVSTVMSREYQKLVSDLASMGFAIQENYFSHKESYTNVKNTSGKGLVGVQITVVVNIIDPSNPYTVMTSEYIIKPDGSRQFLSNNITKNGVKLQ